MTLKIFALLFAFALSPPDTVLADTPGELAVQETIDKLCTGSGAQTNEDLCISLRKLTKTAMQEKVDELCTNLGELADVVMTKRQEGMRMSDMMKLMSAQTSEEDATRHRAIVAAAYNYPQMMVAENRAQFVIEFRNDTEAACFIEFGG